jgi:hypothetical protein
MCTHELSVSDQLLQLSHACIVGVKSFRWSLAISCMDLACEIGCYALVFCALNCHVKQYTKLGISDLLPPHPF